MNRNVDVAIERLNRSKALLGEIVSNFSFSEKPTIQDIERYSKTLPNNRKDERGENSLKWINEYENIYNFIDLAFDLVNQAGEVLERTSN